MKRIALSFLDKPAEGLMPTRVPWPLRVQVAAKPRSTYGNIKATGVDLSFPYDVPYGGRLHATGSPRESVLIRTTPVSGAPQMPSLLFDHFRPRTNSGPSGVLFPLLSRLAPDHEARRLRLQITSGLSPQLDYNSQAMSFNKAFSLGISSSAILSQELLAFLMLSHPANLLTWEVAPEYSR
jgi:hypothetical protein